MGIYLNANSSSLSQKASDAYNQVVNLRQVTIASQPGMWDAGISAFIAPAAGVYQFTGSIVFGSVQCSGDGVIVGFSVNQGGAWPAVSPDLSTTNVLVLNPESFTNGPVAQTVTALLKLNQGDTVQLALQGSDTDFYSMSYCYMSVVSL